LEKCVENQDFEKAAQLRDQIKRTEINKAHIDKLEVELKMVIDKQDFEEAIKLRDKIKELKS
jgi:protein-arginine kinase activator protein McsA